MPFLDIQTWILFALGAFALVAAPGPDFFYVFSRALAQGRRAGVWSALGISLGLLFHTLLAALGLSVILQTSALAFNVVKWSGAAYLIYIGVKALIEYSNDDTTPQQTVPNPAAIVRQGVLTNVFNPKVALTFLAFLPQFVHKESGNTSAQIAVLGLTLVSIAALWFSLVGFFAGTFGERWLRRPRFLKTVQRASGIVMIALGVRLALVSRV